MSYMPCRVQTHRLICSVQFRYDAASFSRKNENCYVQKKRNRLYKTTDTYLGVDKIIFGDDLFVFVRVVQKEF